MVAPSLLVMQLKGGAAPSVQRLTSGTTLSGALDGTFGVNATHTTNVVGRVSMNNAVEFKGAIYAVALSVASTTLTVYRRNPGVGWSAVKAVGALGSANRYVLRVVNTGSGPVLALYWNTASTNYSISKSTDGTSWTDTALGSAGTASEWTHSGILVHRGQIIIPMWGAGGNTGTILVDVSGTSHSTVTSGIPGNGIHSFCTWRGRIMAVWTGDNFTSKLLELTGGAFVSLLDLGSNVGTDGDNFVPTIFNYNNEYLVAIFLDGTVGAVFHNVAKLTPSGSSFTLTTHPNTIPATLRSGGAATSKKLYGWQVFVDNETDPANPSYHLWLVAPSGGLYTYYEFVALDTEMTGMGLAISATNYGLVVSQQGGGEYINTTDADLFPDDAAFGVGAVAGTVDVDFTLRGGNANDDKIVRGYFNVDESPKFTQMTFTGSATGGSATRNGNQVEQCRADGTVQHSIPWAAEAQGVASGQAVHWKLHVITP